MTWRLSDFIISYWEYKKIKERKLTDYEKSKAEKAFCFYHCKGFRDTKRCFCDSKCKDAQEFIQFLDYIVVKTKEDETEKSNQYESITKTGNSEL